MHPHMNHRHREKRVEADGETFPTDNQSAVFALEPGTCPLRLEARHVLVDGASTRLVRLPHPFRELGPDPAAAELMPEILGVIPCIGRDDSEPCAWSPPCTRTETEGIQGREDWGPFVTIGGRRARGQRHTSRIRETVEEHAFPLPAMGDALTTALARGKQSRPRPHTATESTRVPRPG
jgi:hypothetical protein